ncbi:MAG TPA: DNA alkylation repair protein [Bacilli bacterium]|jgi:3-methyladenine DNA glycosylase AlkD|nr:DNA alkylation repair protein [Acholeplasmataceae bacterium]HNZ78136.1 DNA alkylation repair protein [Bacilli bacterium]HOD61188.1 DNA alkylation repair protein [Bacilli bacterium]HOE07088.1 DNA alkylation repair protein [Bacilli bacterium]HOH61993.1 DNA alkylation repair protein [Bacilli bacterium]
MELVKDLWEEKDIPEFQEYLKTFCNFEKIEWSKNLLNTEMPVLAMKNREIRKLAKEIAKGNYLSFLDLMIWEYFENTVINGILISRIDDFDLQVKYLNIYGAKADNWATCDLLSFQVKGKEEKYFNLVLDYIQSEKPFVRRIGMSILFKFIEKEEYIEKIFDLLDRFTEEEHYYVNMMNAWLLCECFIKQREKTLRYLERHHLNKFTINKGIQKCQDSFRVSPEDKEMLLKYKIKK